MKTERPKSKFKRIVVIARDVDGVMPSKCMTLYDTTPGGVIALVKRAAKSVSVVSPAGKEVSEPSAA